MPPISRTERAALADLLEQLGPDAPTLCGDWTTHDLAAHLVVRERRLDSTPGIVLPPLAGHTEAVRRGYARKPYDELVRLVRGGPPAWSPFAVPHVDRLFNTAEYFVHHEDVRRAQPSWAPRALPAAVQGALWRAVQARARLAFRAAPIGVTLRTPSEQSYDVRAGDPQVTLVGEPAELLLYLFGRRDHAHVEVTGPVEAQETLRHGSLAV